MFTELFAQGDEFVEKGEYVVRIFGKTAYKETQETE